MSRWGIDRQSKARALKGLERLGLVRIERRGRASPRITLIYSGADDITRMDVDHDE
jgi:hypothetical protein